MSAIPIDLPDPARRKIEARAIATGRSDAADYIRALIEEDLIGDEQPGPALLSPRTPAEVDKLLHEGLTSPIDELKPTDWADIRKRVDETIASGD